MPKKTTPNLSKLDKAVADARANRDNREAGYREKSLKMYPWICGRCQREFTRETVKELTVHHRDHNHDNNPEDGSNWELLCLYCHDNEHQRYEESQGVVAGEDGKSPETTFKGLSGLADLLKKG